MISIHRFADICNSERAADFIRCLLGAKRRGKALDEVSAGNRAVQPSLPAEIACWPFTNPPGYKSISKFLYRSKAAIVFRKPNVRLFSLYA